MTEWLRGLGLGLKWVLDCLKYLCTPPHTATLSSLVASLHACPSGRSPKPLSSASFHECQDAEFKVLQIKWEVFILRLMKDLGNFMQRISMSQSFPTSREVFLFPAYFLITVASSRMMLPGWPWPIQKSLCRCDTVCEHGEHNGFMVLNLFMGTVKSDGWSDAAFLSSIKTWTSCADKYIQTSLLLGIPTSQGQD